MKKIIFWGTPQFSLPSLSKLYQAGFISCVVSQPDRKQGRGQRAGATPVSAYARENDIALQCPEKLDEDFILKLKRYLPATFVVVAYGKIIPEKVLSLSEMAPINIHPSLLPELRGPSPVQTAIWQGLETTGVSLMVLDREMDHGPIIAQTRVSIEPLEPYFSLLERLSIIGSELLLQELSLYLEGKSEPKPQEHDKATYCRLITKQDAILDWNSPSKLIINTIRAFNPWPGATSRLNKLEVKILKAKYADEKLSPGEIKIYKDRLYVGTADKSVELEILQIPGKSQISSADFIRGYQHKI